MFRTFILSLFLFLFIPEYSHAGWRTELIEIIIKKIFSSSDDVGRIVAHSTHLGYKVYVQNLRCSENQTPIKIYKDVLIYENKSYDANIVFITDSEASSCIIEKQEEWIKIDAGWVHSKNTEISK